MTMTKRTTRCPVPVTQPRPFCQMLNASHVSSTNDHFVSKGYLPNDTQTNELIKWTQPPIKMVT